jgi:hypothetical protein
MNGTGSNMNMKPSNSNAGTGSNTNHGTATNTNHAGNKN